MVGRRRPGQDTPHARLVSHVPTPDGRSLPRSWSTSEACRRSSNLLCEKRRSEHQFFLKGWASQTLWLVAEAELAAEPGAGIDPMPVGTARRDPEDGGRLLAGQLGEVAQLHELGFDGIVLGQSAQGGVEGQ